MPKALANAYIQILPSTKGIASGISAALNDGTVANAGESAGKLSGGGFLGGIKGALNTVAVAGVIKSAIDEGAAKQQSLGGVETLFKASAERVKAAADEAYRTTGQSANEYMENVTGFAASLLQSLGGDTERAAATADMAMRDMSDNANKFGTSMESVTYAYQGFAKQNYTMLDNLKLGYGGTQKEMARLLEDAEKISGIEYDMSSLDDIMNAIHVIQEEMGVTGTTAKEASSTFSGAIASMQAAAKNVLANLTLGEDMTASLSALSDTAVTFFTDNLIPMVINAAKGIASVAPSLVSSLIDAITASAPTILTAIVDVAGTLIKSLADALPDIIRSGLNLAVTLANYITGNLPEMLRNLATLAWELVRGLVSALVENAPALVITVAKIGMQLIGELLKLPGQFLDIGVQMIAGLAEGIWNGIQSLIERVRGWLDELVGSIKSFLGIASPSRVMRDQVGEMMAEGVGLGFEQGLKRVNRDINDALQTQFDLTTNARLSSAVLGAAPRATGAAEKSTAGNVTHNSYYITLDAKNVQEFNDIVRIVQGLSVDARMRGARA